MYCLGSRFHEVIRLRKDLKRGVEAAVWRDLVLLLAGTRVEAVLQREQDDQEWEEAGLGVFESHKGNMEVDWIQIVSPVE